MKRCICRGCGKNYEKNKGARGRYCSLNCKVQYPKSKARCVPVCDVTSLYLREVVFVNGTRHTQQCCKLCLKTTYLPQGSNQVEDYKKIFRQQSRARAEVYGDSFYSSPKWIALRYETFQTQGRICACCGETRGQIHIDHIKPRSKYPELSLDPNNLQVLCEACNIGKGNRDETDWRQKI